jgi:alpha-beta hydrolase superfamily lysophospholipase
VKRARLRRIMWTAAAIALGLYALVVGLASATYRRFLYPAPDEAGLDLAGAGAPKLWTLQASDGVPVHALHFDAPGAAAAVVYFHGNGETMGNAQDLAAELQRRNLVVVLAEYRGYGASRGPAPSEDGLYADATAVLDELARRGYPKEKVVVWGTSLGTGVAAEMATRGRAKAVVLFCPFTSVRAMASHFVPYLPASVVVRDRFDTLAKAKGITIPALVVHGDADEVIPFEMGKSVAAALPNAELVTVKGGHHMDLLRVRPDLVDRVVEMAKK